MPEKTKLYDDSKCTGCRGCQLACKQWNSLKAKQTENVGTYQTPPSLQPNTYMIIRFQDFEDEKGNVKWIFHKEACMHCTETVCVKACPIGALHYVKEYGTVGLDKKKCIGCKYCTSACPFEVPKHDPYTDKATKCDMCESRLENNLDPACVKARPTGALSFGDKEDMLKEAAGWVKQLGGTANIYGDKYLGGTHLVYMLQEKPAVYAALKQNPSFPITVMAWKDWLKPLALLAGGGVIGGAFLHSILHGPKLPDEPGSHKAEGGE